MQAWGCVCGGPCLKFVADSKKKGLPCCHQDLIFRSPRRKALSPESLRRKFLLSLLGLSSTRAPEDLIRLLFDTCLDRFRIGSPGTEVLTA
jgi:hypothetical protein